MSGHSPLKCGFAGDAHKCSDTFPGGVILLGTPLNIETRLSEVKLCKKKPLKYSGTLLKGVA